MYHGCGSPISRPLSPLLYRRQTTFQHKSTTPTEFRPQSASLYKPPRRRPQNPPRYRPVTGAE